MDDRSIDLFNIEQVNEKHATSHVHAYLRATSDKVYTVFVTRYRVEGPVHMYPLAASRSHDVERFGRFSAKRLAELASDPNTLNVARALAGME